MKITYTDIVQPQQNEVVEYSHPQTLDIYELVERFKEDFRNVFVAQVNGNVFIYRAMNRAEFKQVADNNELHDMDKQEIACAACTLWPENYDFENCDAGVPVELTKLILKNSFLDTQDAFKKVVHFYRQDMFSLDNQVICMINEAFPEYDIEVIENWDIERIAKYLTRAEWKLTNLRGLPTYGDPFSLEPETEVQDGQPAPKVETQELQGSNKTKQDESYIPGESLEQRQKRLAEAPKEKMSPQKLAEMKAKFPEINWEADSVLRDGVKGIDGVEDISNIPVALRTGY